jgi:hypothetical protein
VVEIANQTWFREQVEALRPYESIWTDIRLAFKAAGECQDVIALVQLTLAGAAIDQRVNELEELPELLLKVGKWREAVEHLRDGNRLRSDAEQALRLSVRLYEAGFVSEGRRVFELAEPLEFLSGRPIADDNSRPRNFKNLLRAWTQSALIFRSYEEVVRIIQRIRVEPDRATAENLDGEQLSRRVQNWLLLQGLTACCERSDQEGWQLLYDTFVERTDRRMHFFALLRSAKVAYEKSESVYASTLLHQLLNAFQPHELNTFVDTEQLTEVYLNIAELILDITADKSLAQSWSESLTPIPLQDRNNDRRESPIYELQFRYARLYYLLGQTREPESLRDEAEAHTSFGSYVEEPEKQGYRLQALAVFHLARLQAWGHADLHLQPNLFLREVRWVLDLVGPRYTEWAKPVYIELRWSRSWILRCIVDTAVLHGGAVVEELVRNFETRWASHEEEYSWPLNLQREVVVALREAGASLAWAKVQLSRIELTMLKNLDPRERAETCKAQAEAWLLLGEENAAIAELQRMMQAVRGVSQDKDYQLPVWVDWLDRVNQLEPEQAEERLLLMLRRVLSLHGNASGVVDAAEGLVGVMFQLSPCRSVHLFKGLLELDVLGFQGSITYLLKKALGTDNPPVLEALYTVVDLVLPFITGDEPGLIGTLILKTANQFDSEAVLDVAGYLTERIRVDMLSKCRPSWHRAVAAGLQAIGYTPAQVGLQPAELAESPNPSGSSQLDRRFFLKNGEHLEPNEVLIRTQSINDFRVLIEGEDQENTRYFHWETVVEHLSRNLVSLAEIEELENIVKHRFTTDLSKGPQLAQMFLALSKRLVILGNVSSAWRLAEQALVTTEPIGWDSYFDSGTRYEILKHLIAIDANRGRKRAINLYAEDGSKGLISSYRILLKLDRVLELLLNEVPVLGIWSVIEEYLDELFAGVLIEPELPIEVLAATQPSAVEEDTPSRAIATLLSFHLDHPSYPVAQGAVRACISGLLQRNVAIIAALKEALIRTEQSTERALMVLDAASAEEAEAVASFGEILEQASKSKQAATHKHKTPSQNSPAQHKATAISA